MLGRVGPAGKRQGVAAERGGEDRMGALVLAPGEEAVGWRRAQGDAWEGFLWAPGHRGHLQLSVPGP